ncbi:hypothetical protein V6N13_007844 [Hibiscus sabdariffa]
MWTGKSPNMSFMRIWGCKAYVEHQMSTKLEPKSQNALLLDIPKKLRDTISTTRTKCLLLELEYSLRRNFSQTVEKVEILNLKKFNNNKSLNQKLKEFLKLFLSIKMSPKLIKKQWRVQTLRNGLRP